MKIFRPFDKEARQDYKRLILAAVSFIVILIGGIWFIAGPGINGAFYLNSYAVSKIVGERVYCYTDFSDGSSAQNDGCFKVDKLYWSYDFTNTPVTNPQNRHEEASNINTITSLLVLIFGTLFILPICWIILYVLKKLHFRE